MRIVFMGTPGFAATIVENLVSHHEIVAVYTRPDAVRSRGKKLVPSPVKQIAQRVGVPVRTPRSITDDDVLEDLRALAPDAVCVAAYGAILPRAVLDLAPFGCLNVHASLLPRWRGAAPVERAILAGDEQTGVCIMRMEESLDTGDYCISRTTEVGTKNTIELTMELADLGSKALLTALQQIEAGKDEWVVQDDFFATYADKIAKREFFLNPQDEALLAVRKIQASSPAHPSRCTIGDRAVTLVRAQRVVSRLTRSDLSLGPGQVGTLDKRLYMGMGDQPIEITEVKPDGKRAMDGVAFAAGLQGLHDGTVVWEAL